MYTLIRNNGGWDNFSMLAIEHYKCNNNIEAKQKERYYIKQLHATLNSSIRTRTEKEYSTDNKDITKQYYDNNKDKFLEKGNKI